MKTSERLKYIRQRTGLSQGKFAKLLEEKLSRINSIEAGKQAKFPYDLAEKILKNFPEQNYSFKWLTTGAGEPSLREITWSYPYTKEELNTLSRMATDKELELLIKCLSEKKELTIMLLKKLQKEEKSVKIFLLKE